MEGTPAANKGKGKENKNLVDLFKETREREDELRRKMPDYQNRLNDSKAKIAAYAKRSKELNAKMPAYTKRAEELKKEIEAKKKHGASLDELIGLLEEMATLSQDFSACVEESDALGKSTKTEESSIISELKAIDEEHECIKQDLLNGMGAEIVKIGSSRNWDILCSGLMGILGIASTFAMARGESQSEQIWYGAAAALTYISSLGYALRAYKKNNYYKFVFEQCEKVRNQWLK